MSGVRWWAASFSLWNHGFSSWMFCVYLWWTKWHCGKTYSKYICFPCQLSFCSTPYPSVMNLKVKWGDILYQEIWNGASTVFRSKIEDGENYMLKSFIISTPCQVLLGWSNQGGEVRTACSVYTETKNVYQHLKERDHLADLVTYGTIMFKYYCLYSD
jgi:hypothetical protein